MGQIKEDMDEIFNAEAFVNQLLEEGSKVACDDTSQAFTESNGNLPPFFDETTYKRGCKFFDDNVFALFFGKLLGLITALSIPSLVKILIRTGQSGCPATAYKRYLGTIFHMCVWYESDFSAGSQLWQSISLVKRKHNSASKFCNATPGLTPISQKDMAITQFGFMGYAVAVPEKIGIHNVKQEDFHAFIHIWRVIGFLLGIEDRFNICRGSVQETRDICKILMDKVFRPEVMKMNEDFVNMGTNLVDGMWAMNPSLEINMYFHIIHKLLAEDNNNSNDHHDRNEEEKPLKKLSWSSRLVIAVYYFVVWSLQFNFVRHFTGMGIKIPMYIFFQQKRYPLLRIT